MVTVASVDIMRVIFGSRPANGFADEGLEALRRYAVAYRLTRGHDRDHDRAAATSAGVTASALEDTRRVVDGWLVNRPRRALNPALLVWLTLAAVASVWSYQKLVREVGDPLVALVLIGVAAVVLVPLLLPRRVARRP